MQDFWQRLIDRAKELASKHSEAAELLSFYAKLLGAQKRIYESLRNRQGWRPTGALAEDISLVRLLLPGLLEVVAASGPVPLAEQAGHLKQASPHEIDAMLMAYWTMPSDTQFFAKALLQPYAHRLAELGAKPQDRILETGEQRCPFCAGKPQLSVLKTQE